MGADVEAKEKKKGKKGHLVYKTIFVRETEKQNVFFYFGRDINSDIAL